MAEGGEQDRLEPCSVQVATEPGELVGSTPFAVC
jgi:hypothetical protein